MKKSRRAQVRIVNIETDPRATVNLTVAASFLRLNERTVRARIEAGQLAAERDGKVYHIPLDALRVYRRRRMFHMKHASST